MAKVHISNLVEIRHWIVPDEDVNDNGYWVTRDRFQNVNTTTTISYGGQGYSFLSFIYQGNRSRTGDNIQATLLVTTNQISMDKAYDMRHGRVRLTTSSNGRSLSAPV